MPGANDDAAVSPFAPLLAELARMRKSNLTAAIDDVDKIIDHLVKARAVVAQPESDSPRIKAMTLLQNPVKNCLEKVNEDLKEVTKAQRLFGKALDKALPQRDLPMETDAMAAQGALLNRAIAMHLMREGRFNVASTFMHESRDLRTPLPGPWSPERTISPTTDEDGDHDMYYHGNDDDDDDDDGGGNKDKKRDKNSNTKIGLDARVSHGHRAADDDEDIDDDDDDDDDNEADGHPDHEDNNETDHAADADDADIEDDDDDYTNAHAHLEHAYTRASASQGLQGKFAEMYSILSDLKDKKLARAIAWARHHHARLDASGSNLDFELSKLHFLWLFKGPSVNGLPDDARNGPPGAFRYARAHFARFQARHLKEIQQLSCAMLYAPRIDDSPYRHIFRIDSAFDDMAVAFTREFCSLLGLSAESPLYVAVTAGAIALPRLIKYTTYMKEKKTEWTTDYELAFETPLPPSMIYHPIFVCPISKEQTTAGNPPMMLPCGHVVCLDSLHNITKSFRYKCPYCPMEGTMKDAVKIAM